MDEAMRCDRVALMQEGRILQIDSPKEIGTRYPLPLVEVFGRDRYRLLLALRKAPHAHSVYPFGTKLHFTDDRKNYDPAKVAAELRDYLAREGFQEVEINPIEAGIEDRFMDLMPPARRAS
jgi:ABC-type multidrug transport system ATPase subunit